MVELQMKLPLNACSPPLQKNSLFQSGEDHFYSFYLILCPFDSTDVRPMPGMAM